MAAPIYDINAPATVALAVGVAKSILGVRAGATFGLLCKEASVSFDGITAGNHPVKMELCRATFATNATPGTQNTSVTPDQQSGIRLAHGMTAMAAWVATYEPTVLTPIRTWTVHPQTGLIYEIPLGDEPDCGLQEGFVIRLTAAEVVNALGYLSVSRC